ncbi:MAG: type III polyketide synthase [Planctomycetota bacterium]
MSLARLLAVASAVPSQAAPQSVVTGFFVRAYEAGLGSPERERSVRALHMIADRAGIDQRHSVVTDYAQTDPAEFRFYPPSADLKPFPTTAQRMAVYERESVPLALDAARKALERARAMNVAPPDVTHIVFVTCTGFFAPGPDIQLIRALGLRPDVQRTLIGFMGCHAAFNAVRTASHIVQSDASAVVLVVCVELCSLHFQIDPAADAIVANTLFADGACAMLFGAADAYPKGLADVRRACSRVDDDSLDQMSWRIGNHGFHMTLSSDVPHTLHAGAPGFVAALLEPVGLTAAQVVQWAVHPGGVRIIDAIARALELPADAVASAREVLSQYGNMSSATLGFLLERDLPSAAAKAPAGASRVPLVALGFGPGLTIEGLLLDVLPA